MLGFQRLALVWTAVALLTVSLMILAVGLVAPANAQPGATLVIHLAAHRIDAIVPQLLEGNYSEDTPVAVVAFASWPQQVVLRGTLADIAEQMHAAEITRTAVIIVGDVLAAEGFPDSYLYSTGRTRRGRH